MRPYSPCLSCGGSGSRLGLVLGCPERPSSCPECNGSGKVREVTFVYRDDQGEGSRRIRIRGASLHPEVALSTRHVRAFDLDRGIECDFVLDRVLEGGIALLRALDADAAYLSSHAKYLERELSVLRKRTMPGTEGRAALAMRPLPAYAYVVGDAVVHGDAWGLVFGAVHSLPPDVRSRDALGIRWAGETYTEDGSGLRVHDTAAGLVRIWPPALHEQRRIALALDLRTRMTRRRTEIEEWEATAHVRNEVAAIVMAEREIERMANDLVLLGEGPA